MGLLCDYKKNCIDKYKAGTDLYRQLHQAAREIFRYGRITDSDLIDAGIARYIPWIDLYLTISDPENGSYRPTDIYGCGYFETPATTIQIMNIFRDERLQQIIEAQKK